MNYNQIQYREQTGVLITEHERQMGLFLHLSVLANMVVPFAGYVLQIVIWQTKKDEMPAIVPHGKEAVNWMISSFIYTVSSLVLMIVGAIIAFALEVPILGFLIIGITFLVMMAVSIAGIFYAVMGGIKANNGENWEYPFNIKFLK